MRKELRDYILTEKIADGGMSTLYLGIQRSLEREVAIKVLQPALALNESFIRRFEREAKIVSRIRHRNIVSLIDYGTEQELYFIVMEYVEGMDLQRVLEAEAQIPPAVALSIVEEAAQGLEAAHDQGVWHRDIKPANILLSSGGEVKVVDFGLAREASDIARFSSVTQPGTILGTYPYMSPEQATRQPVDQRSDIFSLGALAYELFTGSRAFQGETHTEVIEQILRHPAEPMRDRNVLVTRGIEDVVSRMLRKDPEGRYSSMREVLDALSACWDALDPSGAMIRSRLQYLKNFAQDPVRFSASLRASSIKDLLARGQHFVSLGQSRLGDAIEAYSAVLYLDPTNEHARTSLEDLKNRVPPQDGGEWDEGSRQIPPTTVCGPETDAGAAHPGRSRVGTPPGDSTPTRGTAVVQAAPRSRWRLPLPAIGVIAVVAVLVYAWRTVQHSGRSGAGNPGGTSSAQVDSSRGANSLRAARGVKEIREGTSIRRESALRLAPGQQSAGSPGDPSRSVLSGGALAPRVMHQVHDETGPRPSSRVPAVMDSPAVSARLTPASGFPKGGQESVATQLAHEASPGKQTDSGNAGASAILVVIVDPHGILYVDEHRSSPRDTRWYSLPVSLGEHRVSVKCGDSTYTFPKVASRSGMADTLKFKFVSQLRSH